MHLISAGRNTLLHDFPSLTSKYSYCHSGNEIQDFRFFSDINVFLSINRKSGFELLRTCSKNEIDTIQRMKKRRIDDLSCGACSTIETGDIALGYNTGHIKFFNIISGDFCSTVFKPDRHNNSVLDLAYSSCSEILAGIYENGDINLYGLKTHVKMDSFKLDHSSTLLQFSPLKRFHLGVVSYKGAVTVMDAQAKRLVFQDKQAHADQCSDFCWSPISADTLVSVGYDCKLNIYDIRKRFNLDQITHEHPYSTVALSPCGRYCCAGTLKGDIVSYDFRNLSGPLETVRSQSGNIARIAFVPMGQDKNSVSKTVRLSLANESTFESDARRSQSQNVSDECGQRKDSFNELFDVFYSNSNRISTTKKQRDSIFDMDFNLGGTSSSTNTSLADVTHSNDRQSMETQSIRLKRNSGVSSKVRNSVGTVAFSAPIKETDCVAEPEETDVNPLKRKNNTKRMCMGPDEIRSQIRSDVLQESTIENKMPIESPILSINGVAKDDKENKIHLKKEIDGFNRFLNDKYSSTPHQIRPISKIEKTADPSSSCSGCHEKISKLDTKIDHIANQIKNLSFSVLTNLWSMQDSDIQDIRDGVSALVRQDDFIQEFMALKHENEQLHKKLNQLSMK